jgi:hypothetical protein
VANPHGANCDAGDSDLQQGCRARSSCRFCKTNVDPIEDGLSPRRFGCIERDLPAPAAALERDETDSPRRPGLHAELGQVRVRQHVGRAFRFLPVQTIAVEGNNDLTV